MNDFDRIREFCIGPFLLLLSGTSDLLMTNVSHIYSDLIFIVFNFVVKYCDQFLVDDL